MNYIRVSGNMDIYVPIPGDCEGNEAVYVAEEMLDIIKDTYGVSIIPDGDTVSYVPQRSCK